MTRQTTTRRTDLPPEAYITPPTDTTGSGREGEPSMSRAILLFLENEVEMPDVQRRMIADELAEFLKRAGFGLVEALRRDGERLDWLIQNACYPGTLKPWKMEDHGVELAIGGKVEWETDTCLATVRAAIDSAQRQEG